MSSKPQFIWLASYPKSGNTWVRLFLHALKSGEEFVEFSKIDSTNGISSEKEKHQHYLGLDIDDIPSIQVQMNRFRIFQLWNQDLKDEILLKCHDTPFYKGIRIIPKEVTKKVILIVRNPFDIVASWANHSLCSLDESVRLLCDDSAILLENQKGYRMQLPQHIGSWSSFYWSWKNSFRDDLCIVRYEDLIENPHREFSRIVKELGWNYSDQEISKAIEFTEFKTLKKVEIDKGFNERPENSSAFFRSGKVGNWKNEITKEMADTLISCHFNTLLELNYIDSKGKILV